MTYDPEAFEPIQLPADMHRPDPARPYERLVKEAAALQGPKDGLAHKVPCTDEDFLLTPKDPSRQAEAYQRCRAADRVMNRIRTEIRVQGLTGVVSCSVRSDKTTQFHPLVRNDDGTISIIVHRTKRSFQ